MKMKRIAIIGLTPLMSIACSGPEDAYQRPNIIYIMADDHAFQALSAYGHPISQVAPTPNLDRIARDGMVFRQAFVENSISAPSRATLLTGMYSHHHGQKTLQYGIMDTTVTHFPELLQKAGYQTAIIGKWHLSIEPKGFDYYDIFNDQGEYYNPLMRTPATDGKYVKQEGYATEVITDHALAWLEGHKDSESPFCLMVHHKAPHRNWMPAPQDMMLYEDVEFPEPATLFDDYSTRGEQMYQQQLLVAEHMGYAFDFKVEELKDVPTLQYIHDSWDVAMSTMTPEQRAYWDKTYAEMNHDFLADMPRGQELVKWKYQRYIHDYCRTVHSIDVQVGRILDYLEDNQLLENTVIIYTSDQGFYLGEHGLYDKRFMYEQALRTPLLMSWKGHIAPGSECDAMVQNIDYAPTLLDLAGIEVPEAMDGVSLVPLMVGGDVAGWRDEIYYQYYDYPAVGSVRKHYGIRTERYKLIHWLDQESPYDPAIDCWELYDLQEDPDEVNNVYDSPEYVAILDDLTTRLDSLRQDIMQAN